MAWHVGNKIAASFAAVLVFLLIVGVISYRSNSQLVEVTELRRQTYDILAARDELSLATRSVGIELRNFVITGSNEHRAAVLRSIPQAEQALGELASLQTGAEQQKLIGQLSTQLSGYFSLVRRLVDTRSTSGFEEARAQLQQAAASGVLGELSSRMREVGRLEDASLARHAEESIHAAVRARWTIVLGTILAVAMAALAGLLLTQNLSRPLRHLTAAAERLTAGNLDVSIDVGPRQDEIGALAQSLARMTASLRTLASSAEKISEGDLKVAITPQSPSDVLGVAFARMTGDLNSHIVRLRRASADLGAAANDLVASSSQLATSASQTATAVSETTATVEEVRQTAHVASQKARKVSDGARNVLSTSEDGVRATRDVELGMGRVRSQMETVAASMERLSAQRQAIGEIIASVEDLAVQSNLLAVNAAIEAAKAGEHGRGFSVVAQEVRALAEQSRLATNQVRTMLGGIQKAADEALSASGQGMAAVDLGVQQSETARMVLAAMAESIREAIQASLQIAASSQQQLVGMDQVAGSMNSIKDASVQNLDSASKLESAARLIGSLGGDLRALIERYRA